MRVAADNLLQAQISATQVWVVMCVGGVAWGGVKSTAAADFRTVACCCGLLLSVSFPNAVL